MPNRRERRFAPAAVLLFAFALSGVARADILTNGSFEDGPVMPPEGEMQFAAGSTQIPGWLVTSAPVEVVSTLYWEAAAGSRSLGLNPTANGGGVAQTFATVPGALYEVGFSLSGEPFTTPAVKWIRVSAADQRSDYSFDSSTNWHWSMEWATHAWQFTASDEATTLEFTSLTTGVASPVIDNIVITQLTAGVPPPTLTLSLASQNPARGAVAFSFSLPEAGPARLQIRDAQGRTVATLADGELPAGRQSARWAAQDAMPGMYFVTLRMSGHALTRRFALIR